MLSDYKDCQPDVYNLLMNEINTGHISHAYLIDENDNPESFNIVMAFVKEVLCLSSNSDTEKEIICKRVDDGNYPEVKIISPDGLLIKKQQIIDLQRDFTKVAVEGNRRIYVIRDCEKMRPETANSMLKFLEEPDNSVVAILMTNNYNNLLSTIISRCQVIKLFNSNLSLSNSEFENLVFDFVFNIESKGIRSIDEIRNILSCFVTSRDRDGLIKFFDVLISTYYYGLMFDINNKKISSVVDERLLSIFGKSDKRKLLSKINYLIFAKDSIKYNVNMQLLIDSVVVNLGGCL